jgi:hypothetical protein
MGYAPGMKDSSERLSPDEFKACCVVDILRQGDCAALADQLSMGQAIRLYDAIHAAFIVWQLRGPSFSAPLKDQVTETR